MTTITPALRDKIERRARRAWRANRDGSTRQFTRISDVTADELKYRLPNTPDYYGKEKIRVVRLADGTVEVDPKTKGLIDCQLQTDLDRLKKHGGKVKAYVTVRQNGDVLDGSQKIKPGGGYKDKTVKFKSRAQAIDETNPGDRVLVVELRADDIDAHSYGQFETKIFSVVDELDQEKDLGFTTGLLDCLAKGDIEKVKRHIGSVRAYVLKRRIEKSLTLNKERKPKTGERFKSREEAARSARPGDKVYVAEFDYLDIEKQHTDGLTATVMLTEELDPINDLGFVPGPLIDMVSNSDLKKLDGYIGMVRAYKYVTKDLKSPTQGPAIRYKVGEEFEEPNANTKPEVACGAGINVASQEWCKNFSTTAHRALAFEFHSSDIAAVPNDGGKLRVFRCLCVEEVDVKTFQPLVVAETPKSPQDDLDELCEPPDDRPKPDKGKKKGFFGKLFSKDEAGDDDGV